jgi:hypothetical protein
MTEDKTATRAQKLDSPSSPLVSHESSLQACLIKIEKTKAKS